MIADHPAVSKASRTSTRVKLLRFFAITPILFLLVACGGSGGDSETSDKDQVQMGVFWDGPVHGVDYRSCQPSGGDCLEGVTGRDGEFNFRENDEVTFSLAGLEIGSAKGQPLITPSTLTEDRDEELQIAQLLQSLDEDGDPSNGITISEQVRQQAQLHFTEPTRLSEHDNNLIVNNIAPGRELKNMDAVVEHLAGASRLEQLLDLNSDMARAIIGQSFYPMSGAGFNTARLDSDMRSRMALQQYYITSAIYNESFEQLKAKAEGIDRTRAGINASIEVAKAIADLIVLSEKEVDFSNKLEAAAVINKNLVLFAKAASNAAKTVDSAFEEPLNVGDYTDKPIKAFDILAKSMMALSKPNSANIVDLGTGVAEVPFSDNIWVQRFSNAFNPAFQCAHSVGFSNRGLSEATKLDMIGNCYLAPAEQVFKGLNDFFQASRLSWNNQYMHAHTAAQEYLDAWYKSAQDPIFMRNNFGIPPSLDEAYDFFAKRDGYDGWYLSRFDRYREYFKSHIRDFQSDVSEMLSYYNERLGYSFGGPVELQINTVSGIHNDYITGQGVPVEIQADLEISGNQYVKSFYWIVNGEEEAYELEYIPLQDGSSSAWITFSESAPFRISAYAEVADSEGNVQFAANALTVHVLPKAGDVSLTSSDIQNDEILKSGLKIDDSFSVRVTNARSEVRSVLIQVADNESSFVNVVDGEAEKDYTLNEADAGLVNVVIHFQDQSNGLGNTIGRAEFQIQVKSAENPIYNIKVLGIGNYRVDDIEINQQSNLIEINSPFEFKLAFCFGDDYDDIFLPDYNQHQIYFEDLADGRRFSIEVEKQNFISLEQSQYCAVTDRLEAGNYRLRGAYAKDPIWNELESLAMPATSEAYQVKHIYFDQVHLKDGADIEPVSLLTATPGDSQVSLSWNAVQGSAGYNLYWGTASNIHPDVFSSYDQNISLAGNLTSHTFTGLDNDTTYYFIVTAVAGGQETEPSNEVSATPYAEAIPVAEISIKQTLQTTSYHNFDDGWYKKGAKRNYNRLEAYDVVHDLVTGLLWQDNSDVVNNSYSFGSSGLDDAHAYCSGLNLAGYADWRVPSITELRQLIDFSENRVAHEAFFNVSNLPFLTSTKPAGNEPFFLVSVIDRIDSDAPTVYPGWGNLNAGNRLRCVRGDVISNYGDYTYDGDIAYNQATSLMWQNNSELVDIRKTWDDAIAYCEGLSIGDYSNWRLPNINELSSLIDYNRRPSVVNVFDESTVSNRYWSSTTQNQSVNRAWELSFWNGSSDVADKSSERHVRCVHDM